jgi:hypothetical protein
MGHGRLLSDFKDKENFVWPVRGSTAGATLLPSPPSNNLIPCAPTVFSVDSSDPFSARPLGFGSIAVGGNTLSLQAGLIGFSGPVDLYIGLFAPSLLGTEIYQIRPDLTFQPLSAGPVPWKTSTTAPFDVNLYGDIPVSLLPNGNYTFFFAATPPGTWGSYYLWISSFSLP